MKKRDKVYIEALRILATGCVIFNHLPAIVLFTDTDGIIQTIYMAITVLVKISVPVFFMISGALLLGRKEESHKDVIKNKFMRILITMIIFELGVYILSLLVGVMGENGIHDFSLRYFIKEFLEGSLEYCGAYWYLYIYLGFLLCLPFMQRIAPKMNKSDFIFLIGIHFIFSSLLPMYNVFCFDNKIGDFYFDAGFDIPFASRTMLFFPLIGYYIDKEIDTKNIKKKHIVYMLSVMAVCLCLTCMTVYREASIRDAFLFNYVEIFNYVFAIIIFILFKYRYERVLINRKSYKRLSDIVCFVGPLTFGIYLLDPYMGLVVTGRYFYFVESLLGTLWTSVTMMFVSMTICGTITYILKKMPVFDRLL